MLFTEISRPLRAGEWPAGWLGTSTGSIGPMRPRCLDKMRNFVSCMANDSNPVYFRARWMLCYVPATLMPDTMKPIDSLNDDEFTHLVQRALALPDAPPLLVRAAVALWPAAPPPALEGVAQAAVRLVAAVLSFDSWARPPLALGLRSVASDTRHLLFSAMGRDIDLRISPAAGHFALSGQILGPDTSGVVELVTQRGDGRGAYTARIATLDELGEFRLDNVHGGTYRLLLRMGCDEIALPPIEVGARPR